MFYQPKKNRIRQNLLWLSIILSLLAIPSLPLQAQQPSQPSPAPRPELALQIGHRSFIYRVALSPDGNTAASVSQDGTLKIWDAHTGDLLDTFAFPTDQDIGLQTDKLLFSTDGQTIEFLYHDIEGVRGDVTKQAEYRIKTREFRQFPTATASFCPDQAELVVAAPDRKTAICRQYITGANTVAMMQNYEFFLWEPKTKQKAPITKENQWFDTPAFLFSPDGGTIAIYSVQGELNVVFWDATTRQVKRRLDNVSFKRFSPDGQMIVLQRFGAVELWDMQFKAPKRTLIGREFLNYMPDGQTILLTKRSETGTTAIIELWDAQLKAAKRTLIGGREFFGSTPDGQTILLTKKAETGTTAIMELWDAQLSKLKQKLQGNLPSFSQPLYSPDGRIMALPSETNLASETGREEVLLYDLHAGKIINRLPTGSISDFHEMIVFSQDGATLTTLNWGGEAKLWDAHTGALRSTLKLTPRKTAESTSDSSEASLSLKETAFSADGQMVIFGTQSGAVVILNFRTGRVIQTVALPSNSGSPDFSASNQTIIQAEQNLPAMAWDMRTLQPHPVPPDGAEKPGEESTMTFSPDGRTGAKLSDDRKSAMLYDAQTGKQLHALTGHAGAISVVIFAPDNRTVATVSGISPSLDGLSKAALVLTAVFAGDKKSELDAELNKLAGDRTIKLWDVQTGQLKQTLQCEGIIHQARVLPDGATIIATHSKSMKGEELMGANGFTVWDAQTGKAVKTIKADPNASSLHASFLLSPDGTLVISRSFEEVKAAVTAEVKAEVKAWDARTGELKWKNSEVEISILNDTPFTPDGKLLVAKANHEYAVKLLDAQTGQLRWSLPVHGFTAFSPDGQTIVCFDDYGRASFWDLGTGKLKWSIVAQKTTFPQNPLLANGKLVAVYGQNYAIELRDARDGKMLVSLLALPGTGQANEKGETAPEWIAFTPEGYYSASPGAARYIRWRVGDKLLPAESYAKEFNRPDLLRQAMRGAY